MVCFLVGFYFLVDNDWFRFWCRWIFTIVVLSFIKVINSSAEYLPANTDGNQNSKQDNKQQSEQLKFKRGLNAVVL